MRPNTHCARETAATVSQDDLDLLGAYDDAGALVGECSMCKAECGPDRRSVLCVRLRRLPPDQAVLNVQRNDPVTRRR